MDERRKQEIRDALDKATKNVFGDDVRAVIILVDVGEGNMCKMHGESVKLARLAVNGARDVCEEVRERLGLSLEELGTQVLGVPESVVALTSRMRELADDKPTRTSKFAPSLTDELTKIAKF